MRYRLNPRHAAAHLFEVALEIDAPDPAGQALRLPAWTPGSYMIRDFARHVVDLAAHIAEREGADVDVVRVAALFHDVAKLEVDQDVHAEAGARVAREYLESHGEYPASFVDRVCQSILDHSYQGDPTDLAVETQCLIEADLLDKVGANGTALMLLRMGYEAKTHMDAAEMVQRVLERGHEAAARVESDTAESIAYRRIKRVKWFREWLEEEVRGMDADVEERPE